jgi:hypothetical protein
MASVAQIGGSGRAGVQRRKQPWREGEQWQQHSQRRQQQASSKAAALRVRQVVAQQQGMECQQQMANKHRGDQKGSSVEAKLATKQSTASKSKQSKARHGSVGSRQSGQLAWRRSEEISERDRIEGGYRSGMQQGHGKCARQA